VPWCRFFIPKIASPHIKPDDPAFNDSVMYAKCVKGHVVRDANDWILCENLPAPDAKCWQEGGDTLFSLKERQRSEIKASESEKANVTPVVPTKATSQSGKS